MRAIGSDLHMDYTAVGQTTHLAARLEQMAMPGSILLSAETLALAEGYVEVKAARTAAGQRARGAARGLRADPGGHASARASRPRRPAA